MARFRADTNLGRFSPKHLQDISTRILLAPRQKRLAPALPSPAMSIRRTSAGFSGSRRTGLSSATQRSSHEALGLPCSSGNQLPFPSSSSVSSFLLGLFDRPAV